MISNRFFIIVVLLVLVGQTACSAFLQKTPAGDVLFSDDFTDTSKKWDQVVEPTRTTDYYNSAYRITVNDVNSDTWSNPGDLKFTDTRTEVDATKNAGPDDNDYGVICRYSNTDKFYYGVVSSDGYVAIMKMTASGGTPLGNGSMAENSAVTKGTATNRIRFDCIGSTLTLYVNGTQVEQQTDAEYTEGNVGLLAGTFKDAGADILFDNFIVYKP